RVDSKAAAENAKEIFNSSRSVEEWTIALRNYAWGTDDSRGDPYLVDVSRRLLERTEWLEQASSAYLEAFDLIPYNRDVGYAPKLVQHISASANGDIRHAAFLALDKLMLQAPLELGRTLGEIIPERHSNLRASLMARLDASRDEERELIKEYLSDNTIASGEFQEFFRLYPLTSKAIGPALVTEERFESLQQLAAKDLHALSFLRELSSLPDYIRHAKGFDLAASRIELHVRAAANSGLFEKN
ncbi:MAG: hypothetical protein J5J00_04645, partial [Deltaproteobacteria bacterium]|nr:hypothetical protein [Deltaproteobacteria bacterium]